MGLIPESASSLIPAAQYVRMSDEAQEFSIENQKAAIKIYADLHGFAVVKTYADAGKSGVIAKHRAALQQLLKDVVNGDAGYRAILVYDVSRWGRFPNSDEAAHYEFLCLQSGIPLHYCAEPFTNDCTASSSILKALKRSMASEFSRELGEKVFRGKSRLVQLGFWVGSSAGYGFRRLMVSADGKHKQLLKKGECKSLTTDRIILVLGSRQEVECVRRIFAMVLQGLSRVQIARVLNHEGIKHYGKDWQGQDIYNIVTNPKYAGCNVWNRRTAKLRGKVVRVEPGKWVMKPGAFASIVDPEIFDRAQVVLPREKDYVWSDAEILRKIRRLLRAKGRLTERLILKARGMPSTSTLHNHFGSYRNMYKLIGYEIPEEDLFGSARAEGSMRLRRRVVRKISDLFPNNVTVTHLPHRSRSILCIDNQFTVSVLLCRIEHGIPGERPRWIVQPNPPERDFITLLCRLDDNRKRIISYHLFADMRLPGKTHCSYKGDAWLRTGVKLANLSIFYKTAKRLWRKRDASPNPVNEERHSA
jgi:DNA invertase Pin-like site-specific DNA recombinase